MPSTNNLCINNNWPFLPVRDVFKHGHLARRIGVGPLPFMKGFGLSLPSSALLGTCCKRNLLASARLDCAKPQRAEAVPPIAAELRLLAGVVATLSLALKVSGSVPLSSDGSSCHTLVYLHKVCFLWQWGDTLPAIKCQAPETQPQHTEVSMHTGTAYIYIVPFLRWRPMRYKLYIQKSPLYLSHL